MKYTIKPIVYSTIKPNVTHFSLFPHPFVTYRPYGNVVSSDLVSWRLVFGISLIFFEIAILVEEDFDELFFGGKIEEVSGDEPFESQVTSVPEKTIEDLQN